MALARAENVTDNLAPLEAAKFSKSAADEALGMKLEALFTGSAASARGRGRSGRMT